MEKVNRTLYAVSRIAKFLLIAFGYALWFVGRGAEIALRHTNIFIRYLLTYLSKRNR